jgi:hypothetical protein
MWFISIRTIISLKYIFTQPDLNMRPRRWLELIKDYELEVHYHRGKVNIITDALSHKAHCNCLSAIHETGEESSTRVLPILSLFNITLMPTLKARRMMKAWVILREECEKVTQRSLVSVRMWKEPYGSRKD